MEPIELVEIVATVIGLAVIFAIFWLYDTLDAYCLRKFKMPLKDPSLVAILLVILGYVAWVVIRFYVTGEKW